MSVFGSSPDAVPPTDDPFRGPLTAELTRFLMAYKFGLDEMMTKIHHLKEELTLAGDYCPIVMDMLTGQPDVELLRMRDYIASPEATVTGV